MSERHGWLWGFLISVIPFCDFILRPSFRPITMYSFDTAREAPAIVSAAYFAVLLLLLIPVGLGILRYGLNFFRGARLLLVLSPLIILLPLSLIDLSRLGVIQNVIVMYYIFGLMLAFVCIRYSDEFMLGFLSALAIGHTAALMVVIGYGEYTWGRLTSHNSPNYWGFTSLAAIFASIALKKPYLKYLALGVGATTLYLTQARGSMLAAVVGLSLVFLLILWVSRTERRFNLLFAASLGLVLGVIALGPTILDKVLLVGDAQRGLNSGGTGRTLAWREAWQLIVDSPFIGVGFKQHNAYITRASSAHNAYLTVGSELGLIGLAAYIVFLAGGLWRSVRRYVHRKKPIDLAVAGYLSAFLAVGMLETYSLNTSAIVMLLMAAWSWGDRIGELRHASSAPLARSGRMLGLTPASSLSAPP